VVEQSQDVCNDIHENSKEFIRKYLMQYPERRMAKLQIGQPISAELEGKWWQPRVTAIDASLATLSFEATGHVENIYRGSTRLGPLYKAMQQQRQRQEQQAKSQFARRDHSRQYAKVRKQMVFEGKDEGSVGEKRATARKSGSGGGPSGGNRAATSALQGYQQPFYEETPMSKQGEVFKVTVPRSDGETYRPHECTPLCVDDPKYRFEDRLLALAGPLMMPIMLGWQRQCTKHKNQGKRTIFYVAPCGRRLRSLAEVHK